MCRAPADMTDSLHFHFKKNKKQDNQTAFAGSKKKKIIQEWAQRHVAYYPIFTLRHDKHT